MADAARANDPRSDASKDKDLISRGGMFVPSSGITVLNLSVSLTLWVNYHVDYTSTPVGKSVFFLVRAIDPFVQYSILAHGAGTGLLHNLGLRTLPPGLPAETGVSSIDALGLSPYRLVLFGMSVGSAVSTIPATALSVAHDNARRELLCGFPEMGSLTYHALLR